MIPSILFSIASGVSRGNVKRGKHAIKIRGISEEDGWVTRGSFWIPRLSLNFGPSGVVRFFLLSKDLNPVRTGWGGVGWGSDSAMSNEVLYQE